MNQRLALQRLVWKELRQLAPLVSGLLLMGLAIHLFFLLGPSYGLLFRQNLVLFGLPCLYAVGTSALLVGQEREQRTLQWLSSLPIAARDIIRIKLLVSFLGLLAIWLGSGLLFLVARSLAGSQDSSGTTLERGTEILWPLHSVYLLLIGFASAWRVRAPLISLLWLVPLACLPQLLSSVASEQGRVSLSLSSWLRSRSSNWMLAQPAVELTAFWMIVFSVLALLYGWRSAKLALAPMQPMRKSTLLAAFNQWTYRPQHSPQKPVTSLYSALIWQFACQNGWALGGVGALCLMAVGLLVTAGSIDHVLSGLAAMQVTVATAWLGILIFQSDQQQQRLNFLAVRGVSPAVAWLTRQLVPCGLFTAILFGCGGLIMCYQRLPWTGLPIGSAMLALLFATYGIAQWVGQLIKSPIVAALLTPLVCILLMGIAMSASAVLATPLVILMICSLIPFMATFSMMRPFMDGRMNLIYWLQHACWLGLIVLLLVSTFLIDTLQQPSLSRTLANQFQQEAERLGRYRVQPYEIVLKDRQSPAVAAMLEASIDAEVPSATDESQADSSQSVTSNQLPSSPVVHTAKIPPSEQRSDWLRGIERQLAQHSGPIQFSRAIQFLRSDMLLARLRLQQTTSDADSTERYRQDVKLLLTLLQRLRLSPRLLEQEFADVLEIALLQDMQLPNAKLWLGDEAYLAVAKWLGDQDSRNNARRRAIILTWSNLQSAALTDNSNEFLAAHQSTRPWPQLVLRKRRASYMAGQLMEYLAASQPEQRQRLLEELAEYWHVPAACYVNPMASNKSPEATEPLLELLGNNFAPGRHWHGAWEMQAQELLKSISPPDI